MLFGDLLDTTLAHARAPLAHSGLAARVDRFVTSRSGFLALQATTRGTERERQSRLAVELAAAVVRSGGSPEGASALVAPIAARVVDVVRLMGLSAGAERTALAASLAEVAPVSAGVDPYRPVAVPVTRMAQRQVDLGGDFAGTFIRMASAGANPSRHLLLIHGHASRIEEYEDLAALLEPHFTIHVVDLPGCGYSEKPSAPYSLAYFERVLERVLDTLGIGTAVPGAMLAGGGLGGNLALRLAHRDAVGGRNRIARVAAWSVAGWGATRPLLAFASRALSSAPRFLFYAVAKGQLGQQYSPGWSQRDTAIAAGMAYRREVFVHPFQNAYAAIAAEQVGTSMLSRAAEIRAPVLLLAGELDRGSLDIRAAVENLGRAMGIAPVIVGGSGYAIAVERPDELAARLVSFFDAG